MQAMTAVDTHLNTITYADSMAQGLVGVDREPPPQARVEVLRMMQQVALWLNAECERANKPQRV